MAQEQEILITREGLEKLKSDIEHLSTVGRAEVAERIKEARGFGDISENSEYDDAKNEQALLESKIARLQEKLRSARVLDESEIDVSVVSTGCLVNIKDQDSGKSLTYHIVGPTEADPGKNRLSNESPVAKALLGHKKNEVITVPTPRGSRKLKITKISTA